jgi:hypothetical protein
LPATEPAAVLDGIGEGPFSLPFLKTDALGAIKEETEEVISVGPVLAAQRIEGVEETEHVNPGQVVMGWGVGCNVLFAIALLGHVGLGFIPHWAIQEQLECFIDVSISAVTARGIAPGLKEAPSDAIDETATTGTELGEGVLQGAADHAIRAVKGLVVGALG